MLVKIEARILIFPGTDFHFPSTSVPPGTFLGSATVKLHAATLSHNQTRLLHHFSRFTFTKQFQNDEIVPYLIFSEFFY